MVSRAIFRFAVASASVVVAKEGMVAFEVGADGDAAALFQTVSDVRPAGPRGLRVAVGVQAQGVATLVSAVGLPSDEYTPEAVADIFLLQTSLKHPLREAELGAAGDVAGILDDGLPGARMGMDAAGLEPVALLQTAMEIVPEGQAVQVHTLPAAGPETPAVAGAVQVEQSRAPAEPLPTSFSSWARAAGKSACSLLAMSPGGIIKSLIDRTSLIQRTPSTETVIEKVAVEPWSHKEFLVLIVGGVLLQVLLFKWLTPSPEESNKVVTSLNEG